MKKNINMRSDAEKALEERPFIPSSFSRYERPLDKINWGSLSYNDYPQQNIG